MSESSEPIVVEQAFPADRHTVWQAITDRDQMVQWFFDNIPEFRPEAGFKTQFLVDAGERKFEHLWEIKEAVPDQKIVYDWRYEEYPGAGIVTFELFDDGDGSRLRVTTEGMESFPDDVPEFNREACEGGWKYFIQGNLNDYLQAGR